MIAKKLIFGRSGVPALLEANAATYTDDGVIYNADCKTNRVAPAGIGGEFALFLLYISVTYDVAVPIVVTPIVDGVALTPQTFNVPAPAGPHATVILEVPIGVKFPGAIPNAATLASFAARGTWLQVEVATGFTSASGYVAIDGVEAEIEITREGKKEGVN